VDVDGRDDPTVGKQFHRADAEPFVALTGRSAVEPRRVGRTQDRGGVGEREHREGQRSGCRERRVRGLGGRWTRGVVHAGDAVDKEGAGASHDVLGPPIGISERCERCTVRGAPGPFEEQPVRLAVGVAADLAAGRIRRGPPDAELVEAAGVHDALVEAVVHGDDRPVEAQRVEVASVGDQPGSEVGPARAPDPWGLGFAVGLFHERRAELVRRGRGAQIAPARLERGDGEVVVRVDETGTERASREVDDCRVRVRIDEVTLADGDDPVVAHHDDVGRGSGHREDPPVREHPSR
jgi:hypothetical protein